MVTPYLGVVGPVLLAFGVFGGFAMGDFAHPLILAHLLVGIVSIVMWGVKQVQTPRGQGASRSAAARYSGFTVASSVLTVALIGMVYFFGQKYNRRIDLTEQRLFSLSPKSEEIVKGLSRPLRLVGLVGVRGNPAADDQIRELLNLYGYASSKISVSFVDPKSGPTVVKELGFKPGNAIYIQYDGAQDAKVDDPTEEAVTNAIIKLTRGAAKKVYFLEGHDEAGFTDAGPQGIELFVQALRDSHLDPQPLLLAQVGVIPSDAGAVVVASPKRPLTQQEQESLINYMNQGGRLLLLTDPQAPRDVAQLAGKVGITVRDDVVIDQVNRLFSGPELGVEPISRAYGRHPITKSFVNTSITIFPLASSVSVPEKSDEGVTYTQLVKTGPQAWGESNLTALFQSEKPVVSRDAEDAQGPVTLGAVYEKNITGSIDTDSSNDTKRSTRVVVFGDSDFLRNGALKGFAAYVNRDLAVNVVNWLAGEEGGLSIGPRSMRNSTAPIQAVHAKLLLVLSLLVPEMLALGGLIIWIRRREASAAAVA